MSVLSDDVPANVREVWDSQGGQVYVPPDDEPVVQDMYRRGNEGLCMMCNSPLGNETQMMVNLLGIYAVYCSVKCEHDMHILGWLSHQYDDIREGVEFRGMASADEGEE